MGVKRFKDSLRSFWDFLILFSGISTARNLSRTRKDPVFYQGWFLFRKPRSGSRTDSQDPR
jgi:hypothetical protein